MRRPYTKSILESKTDTFQKIKDFFLKSRTVNGNLKTLLRIVKISGYQLGYPVIGGVKRR